MGWFQSRDQVPFRTPGASYKFTSTAAHEFFHRFRAQETFILHFETSFVFTFFFFKCPQGFFLFFVFTFFFYKDLNLRPKGLSFYLCPPVFHRMLYDESDAEVRGEELAEAVDGKLWRSAAAVDLLSNPSPLRYTDKWRPLKFSFFFSFTKYRSRPEGLEHTETTNLPVATPASVQSVDERALARLGPLVESAP